ncbi:MAG: ACT domain-containing protein [Aureliella sp.]
MKQITIIIPTNQPGTVATVAELLAEAQVNITSCDANDDGSHGLLVLRAEPYEVALRVLSEAGYQALGEDLIVLKIKDEPGALARVSSGLREPGINIRSMRFARRENGWAIVILSTDDDAKARELLEAHLVSVSVD